jgi:DNA-binding transcriptional MerR regulator
LYTDFGHISVCALSEECIQISDIADLKQLNRDGVQLVRRALAIGFTLHDLAAVLSQRDRGGAPCRSVRELVAQRLAELETRLSDLAELRDELRVLLRDWDLRLAKIPRGAQARLLDVLADRPVVDRAAARQQRTIRSANPRQRLEGRQ